MNTHLLSWNPDTCRCHGVRQDSPEMRHPELLIRITRVPQAVTLPEVCMLVERRPEVRLRRKGTYEELRGKTRSQPRLRKAG